MGNSLGVYFHLFEVIAACFKDSIFTRTSKKKLIKKKIMKEKKNITFFPGIHTQAKQICLKISKKIGKKTSKNKEKVKKK